MLGDPRYDFFIVGCGPRGANFLLGEARAIQLLPRGMFRARGYIFMEGLRERELLLPTAMLWRKLTIDPWTEALTSEQLDSKGQSFHQPAGQG